MAITNNSAKFLFYARQSGVSFEDTLMLGRLHLYASRQSIQENIDLFAKNELSVKEVKFPDEYSEPLFKILGAKTVNSLDYSDYENASIVHDLNIPIPDQFKNRFSAVVDGGTVEHVFNFPVAIKNCMEAVKLNGHYIGITPVNNQMGHGFYQFSPELYYRVFSKENGFEVVKMIICAHADEQNVQKWYEVPDPIKVNNRVMLVNNFPTSILLIAKKTHQSPIFAHTPQQSDYATTWVANDSIKTGIKPEGVSKVKHLYRKLIPKKVKIFLRNSYNLFTKEKQQVGDLGQVDPTQFKEIKL
jgi:hypothetical protein